MPRLEHYKVVTCAALSLECDAPLEGLFLGLLGSESDAASDSIYFGPIKFVVLLYSTGTTVAVRRKYSPYSPYGDSP